MSHDLQSQDDSEELRNQQEKTNYWEYEPDRNYSLKEAARVYGAFRPCEKPERAVKLWFRGRDQVDGKELAQHFERLGIRSQTVRQGPVHVEISTKQISPATANRHSGNVTEYGDVVGTNHEDSASELVPSITFANLTQDELVSIHNYIAAEIDKFKKATGERNFSYVAYSNTIALDCDFLAKDMDYFYEILFGDIHRGDDGKVAVSKKVAVTFDEKSAPVRVFQSAYTDSYHDNPTGRRYGSIDINGFHSGSASSEHRVCYYFYLSLQEILDILRNR